MNYSVLVQLSYVYFDSYKLMSKCILVFGSGWVSGNMHRIKSWLLATNAWKKYSKYSKLSLLKDTQP